MSVRSADDSYIISQKQHCPEIPFSLLVSHGRMSSCILSAYNDAVFTVALHGLACQCEHSMKMCAVLCVVVERLKRVLEETEASILTFKEQQREM